MLHQYSELPDDKLQKDALIASERLAKLQDRVGVSKLDLKVGTNVVQLPSFIFHFLMDMLAEVSKGNAVTIVPLHAEMTTQEAADHLNVSRPFLVSLLNEGKVPFRKVGNRRRIKAIDLYKYKEQQEKESAEALQELADQAQKLDMGY